MQFIKPGISIDFIGKRKFAFVLSLAMVIITLFLVVWRGGPNLGVDFSGGILIQVKLETKRTPSEIRDALQSIELQDSIIQEFGEEGQFEYLIRVTSTDIQLSGLSQKVKETLASQLGEEVEIRRVEMVGPKVGKDLRQKACWLFFMPSFLLPFTYLGGSRVSGCTVLSWPYHLRLSSGSPQHLESV